MFQPVIVIYRRGNLCIIIGACTSIYRPLSYPLRSLIKKIESMLGIGILVLLSVACIGEGIMLDYHQPGEFTRWIRLNPSIGKKVLI